MAGETAIAGWRIYIGASDIDCQENPVNNQSLFYIYRDATITRDVLDGTPIRLTTTCTVALSDTTSTTQISSVSTLAEVSTTGYPTYGSNGANTMSNDLHSFTRKDIPALDRVDIQHNQLVSINVVISFQSGS
ncbi:MAG: hypothetical protein CL896_00290 [Dehalococcoidia bacterium]|nr:hypothetical protein [Dehalococcoidia bacterium]